MEKRVTDYWLYRHRYALGYSLGLLLITVTLTYATLFVPGGIRAAEQATSVASGQLAFTEFNPETVINLPYHILQRGVFAVVGIDVLSIKIISLVMGVTAVVGLYLLIREWFRNNVAQITTVIVATLPAFVFIAQDGTPTIYAIAVSIWLLLSATYVSRRRDPQLTWKIIFFCLLGLNLYTPLGVYLNIALVSTIIFHPHIRHSTRMLNPNRIAIASAMLLVILAPLLYSLVSQPQIGMTLIGLPSEMPDFAANGKLLLDSFASFSGSSGGLIHPIFPIGVLVIIAIGMFRFLQVKYTARSYIVWIWAIVLLPLIAINPEYAILTLPLAALMIAMGINTLIAEWYKLFPLNPYARVFGLIPLGVIIAGVVFSGMTHYYHAYLYAPGVADQFNDDVRMVKKVVERAGATSEQQIVLGVDKSDLDFYKLVASYDGRFTVTSDLSNAPLPHIAANSYEGSSSSARGELTYIAVNRFSQDSDRFYLYEQIKK